MTRPLHTVETEAYRHHTFYVNPISTEQAFENEDDEAYTDIDIHTSTPESQEHTYDYIDVTTMHKSMITAGGI